MIETAPARSRTDAALPGFVIIGAAKCGSTSLHAWLSRHPQAFMHPWKEMRFFCDAHRWHEGPDWYAAQFAGRGAARIWGEASNAYTRGTEHGEVPARLAALLPAARLIYVVRDPMRRLISHYRHRLATGREWRSPAEAIRADPAYVDTGLYGAELARWIPHVAPERILVVQSEALFADPGPQLARICNHLGVDAAPDLPFHARNVSAVRHVLPRPLRRLSAFPSLRGGVKRLSRYRFPFAAGLGDVSVDLPPELAAQIAGRFAADRLLLERYAGPNITKGWA